MVYTLLRESYLVDFDAILGRLVYQSLNGSTTTFRTLERMSKSIPLGSYRLSKSWSPRFERFMNLVEVPYRSGIRIHSGNYASQSEGCILLGMDISYLKHKDTDLECPYLTRSKHALHEFEICFDMDYLNGACELVVDKA